MTATAQLTRQKQVTPTESWSLVFPAEQKTVIQSEVFIKKLLAVGISSITYLRTIFPESSYHQQHLDGLKLKLLVDNTNCRSSNMVVSWMRSCFEAIEKKYLRQLTFAIINKNNICEAYETYTYKFRYTENDIIMSGPGAPDFAMKEKDTRRSTEKMLRTILLLTQNMDPLPKSIGLSVKLGYYDDVTPEDYEPLGFTAAEEESFTFRSKPVTIKVGNVSTKFHAMKLHVCIEETAYPNGENSPDLQAEEPQEEVERAEEDNSTIKRSYRECGKPLHVPYFTAGTGSQDATITNSQKDDHLVPTQSLSTGIDSAHDVIVHSTQEDEERQQSSNPNSEDFPVRCPCGVPYDQGLMILCDICQEWQHGACFNVLEDSEVKARHVCEECATPSQPCTDLTLPQQSELEAYCLFRRTLVLLDQIKSCVTAASLAQLLRVDITMGNFLFTRLQSEKIVYMKRKMYYINHSKLLYEVFPKYLKGHETAGESQQTININSQTPQNSRSTADMDSDATPDLMSSAQESFIAPKPRCRTGSLNNSLDETIDIVSISQDVTVGTQNLQWSSKPSLEPSQNDTLSDALATASNTLLLLDSPLASQKDQECYSTTMPLHSGTDLEEGSSELLGTHEPSQDPAAKQSRLSLGRKSRRGRGRPKRQLDSKATLNDRQVILSQVSDVQIKTSISPDSEVSRKRKKTLQ